MPLFTKTLWDQRIAVLAYGLGLAAYAVLIVALFPAFQDTLSSVELPAGFESFLGAPLDFSDPRNYFQTEFLGWVPLLISIFAVTAGTGALGAEEGSGRMESLLTLPVSRTETLLAKAAAVGLATAVIAGLMLLGFAVAIPVVGVDVSVGVVLRAGLSVVPFAWVSGALSFYLAAAAPSRATAAGITAGLVVAWWLADSISRLSPTLGWARFASPYYYSDMTRVLTQGLVPWHFAVNLAVVVGLVLLALHAFQRRDIGAHRWQW